MKRKAYEKELAKLEIELVKLQGWIKAQGLKIVVIFEGGVCVVCVGKFPVGLT